MKDEEHVIMSGATFDLPTDNYEEFDQDIDAVKLKQKIVQKNSLKGSIREYQFYDTHDLLISSIEKKKNREKNYRINLAWLSPEPTHNKVIIWKWLYIALFAMALSCLCLYLGIEEIVKLEYCVAAVAITLATAGINVLIFIYQMRDEYIFKSHFGGAALFLIENKKPTQSQFDHFFINLQNSIDRSQQDIPTSDKLVGELKMCRRLRDEGILDDTQYTSARSLIFKHKQYKA